MDSLLTVFAYQVDPNIKDLREYPSRIMVKDSSPLQTGGRNKVKNKAGGDPVEALKTLVKENTDLYDVAVLSIRDPTHDIRGKKRVVVYVKNNAEKRDPEYDSVALFLVTPHSHTIPCPSEVLRSVICNVKQNSVSINGLLACLSEHKGPPGIPKPQGATPVLDTYLPTTYLTTTPHGEWDTDSFGRKYEPATSHVEANPWTLYSTVTPPLGTENLIELETHIADPRKVLGRGGFAITVALNRDLVAKTSLYPETLDWSIPRVRSQFDCYAHVACQAEEAMIGLSLKHENVLRTVCAFWCEKRDYRLGGKAVIVMERALCTIQEFMWHIKETTCLPLAELDTLRALDYLRSRAIQHRDLTYRNILVCQQQGRNPLPLAFKISDFGTSCNYATPGQRRGALTIMPPEVLWCLASATGSDVFSWFAVMWELYHKSPMIPCLGPDGKSCRRTYARNMSELLGVYNPIKDETFEYSYMVKMCARELHSKYRSSRPTARQIQDALAHRVQGQSDHGFLALGPLCVTLYPQERWTPSELLSLDRYTRLSGGVDRAKVAEKPLVQNLELGMFKPTDFLVADDCAPESMNRCQAKRFKSTEKTHYGMDYARIAPDLIQPYEWYKKKAHGLESLNMNECTTEETQKETRSVTTNPAGQFPVTSGAHTAPCEGRQHGRVLLRVRRVPGEIETVIVIAKTRHSDDEARFKREFMVTACALTASHPDIFAGPKEGSYTFSSGHGTSIFYYANFFSNYTPLSTHSEPWRSKQAPLLQIFLTFRAALEANVLPTQFCCWDHVLLGQGSAIIDLPRYLCDSFGDPVETLFGQDCRGFLRLSLDLVDKHAPNSDLCYRLHSLDAGSSTGTVLKEAIDCLMSSCRGPAKRVRPAWHISPGAYFTFRDFLREMPNWVTTDGETENTINCASLVVCGNPMRDDKLYCNLPESPELIEALVRNIVLRLKVKVFTIHRLNVTTLDLTQGLCQLTVSRRALDHVPSVDSLDRVKIMHTECTRYYAHDANSPGPNGEPRKFI
ncbi:hypothetical protein WMY93_031092 [Mugilogobius chulae]|uniref:Protein kinase domain-containing protein n=1 Tax=Mugilogobius chulae TaxID=88201 RepID=A0AAW0ME56_9GOBI